MDAKAIRLTHPMLGKLWGANFPEDTLTFRMEAGYYAAAGEYVIAPAEHFRAPGTVGASALIALVEKWRGEGETIGPSSGAAARQVCADDLCAVLRGAAYMDGVPSPPQPPPLRILREDAPFAGRAFRKLFR